MDGTRPARFERTVDLRRLPRIHAAHAVPLTGGEVLTFTTVWIVVLFLAGALEPPPADPNAAPVLGAVLMTLFLLGTGITAVLALTRSRFRTAAASLFTGTVALAMTVACPAVGHHHLAPWWFLQLLLVTAPTVWSLRQLEMSRQ